jgi:hypothetical protein
MPKPTLVVCYSRTGTTRKLAEAIAKTLDADLGQIGDRKSRRGPVGFVTGGKDAFLKRLTEIDEPEQSPADYERVLIGTPVWASTMAPAIRTWLTRHRDELSEVAFFLTTGGSGIDRTFTAMAELAGRSPVATLGLRTGAVRKDQHGDPVAAFAASIQKAAG